MPRNQRLSPEIILSTPGARDEFTIREINKAMARHLAGDWGQVDTEDEEANDLALTSGNRILGVYPHDDRVLWIITDAGHATTTALLPDEY